MTATRAFTPSSPPCNIPFYNGLEEEGCYYFNARWYDASTGRFISEDPIRAGANWNIYVNNNPLNFIDPTGLDPRKNGNADYNTPDFDRNYDNDDDDGKTDPKKEKNDSYRWSLNKVGEGFRNAWDETKTLPEVTVDAIVAAEDGLKEAGSIIASQSPGVGDIKDIVEAVTGIDPITGQELSNLEQIISVVCAVAPVLTTASLRRLTSGLETVTDTKAIQNFYPSNDGALGSLERIHLEPGTKIDRFGNLSGKYFSPAGTPIEMRALPPNANLSKYRSFEVVKPFEVESSIISPAFGKTGFGTQYRSGVSADVLLRRGIIK